jgi:hypothetical protein
VKAVFVELMFSSLVSGWFVCYSILSLMTTTTAEKQPSRHEPEEKGGRYSYAETDLVT